MPVLACLAAFSSSYHHLSLAYPQFCPKSHLIFPALRVLWPNGSLMLRPPLQPRNAEVMQVDETEKTNDDSLGRQNIVTASDTIGGCDQENHSAPDAKESIVTEDGSVLGDPTKVGNDLEKLLGSHVNFGELFSFYRSYSDAPNPAVSLPVLGGVGLPLSVREAQSIKSQSAIKGMEDEQRMVVDEAVPVALELDHKLVSFENPKWRKFVARIVQDSCLGLGIDFKLHKPRCELRRLLLVEAGSQLNIEESDGHGVNIVVMLPSEYAGGAVCTSYNGVFNTYDCAFEREVRTHVLAWHNNVTCHFKPLTDGFRLALSYRLVPTTRSTWPALPTSDDMTAELYRILRTWKADHGARTPEKMIYLLEDCYSLPKDVKFDKLKNTDLQRVAFLRRVAERLGFGMGLVTVHARLAGYCEEDETNDNPRFDSVGHEEIDVEDLVDLEGRPITHTLPYLESETIPSMSLVEYFSNNVTPIEADREAENFIVKYYSRTAVVLWPSWSNFAVRYSGRNGFVRACEELAGSQSLSPSEHETELAEFVLARLQNNPNRAVAALCSASLTWNSPKWWNKILVKDAWPNGTRIIANQDKFKAVERFGFESVRVGMESMLEHFADNASRLAFLSEFHRWTTGLDIRAPINPSAEPILHWITAQTQPLFDAMIVAPKPTDCASIMQTACMSGGLALLQSRMKHLLERCDDYMLAEFAQQIIKVFSDSPERQSTAAAFLTAAIAKAEFVPLPLSSGLSRPVRDPTVAIEVCRKAQCDHLIPIIVDRVMGATYLPAPEAQACARGIMLPLLEYLIERHSQSSVIADALEKLRTPTLTLFMDFLTIHPNDVDAKGVATLVKGAVVENNFELFDAIAFRLDELPLPVGVLRTVAEVLCSNHGLFGTPEMQEQHARPVSLLFGLKYANAVTFGPGLTFLDVCDWTLTHNMPELVDVACKRVLDPKNTSIGEVKKKWLPMVPELHRLGARHDALDTLAPVFQAIVSVWLDKTMMTPPNASLTLAEDLRNLKRWECNCQYCRDIREFLVKKTDRTNRLEKIGVSMSRHVEMQILANARSLATAQLIGSTPQGIAVSKSEELYKLVWWRMKQTRGRDMLKSIGTNHDELRRLLGPVYQRAMDAVHGNLPAPTPTAAPLHDAPQSAAPAFPAPTRAGAPAVRARVTGPPTVHALAAQSSTVGHPVAPSTYARNVSTTRPMASPRTSTAYAAASARAAPVPPVRDVKFIPDGPIAKKAKTSHRFR